MKKILTREEIDALLSDVAEGRIDPEKELARWNDWLKSSTFFWNCPLIQSTSLLGAWSDASLMASSLLANSAALNAWMSRS